MRISEELPVLRRNLCSQGEAELSRVPNCTLSPSAQQNRPPCAPRRSRSSCIGLHDLDADEGDISLLRRAEEALPHSRFEAVVNLDARGVCDVLPERAGVAS